MLLIIIADEKLQNKSLFFPIEISVLIMIYDCNNLIWYIYRYDLDSRVNDH